MSTLGLLVQEQPHVEVAALNQKDFCLELIVVLQQV